MTRLTILALMLLFAAPAAAQTVQEKTNQIRGLLDQIDLLAVPLPPPSTPVDCVVSSFAIESASPWSPAICPASGLQTNTEAWARTVVTAPANGGLACPTLTETRPGTQVCIYVPPNPPPPTPSGLVFSTTFACATWQQTSGTDPCAPNDGIGRKGDWTMGGKGDEIVAAANNPAGSGGGFRHWRGNGSNSNGGGLRISLPKPASEIWVRSYMRYQAGFGWAGGSPSYIKDHYWGACGSGCVIFGMPPGHAWGLSYNGSTNYPSSYSWTASQGGSVADGQFHVFEYHLKQNGTAGVMELWVDGTRYLTRTGIDLGSTPFSSFTLGSNQSSVTGCASGCYTDYDDIAISTSGYIGLLP